MVNDTYEKTQEIFQK